ncbi:MAG: serine hydrolase domain-containing protein [Actinocatenispora sp.]
MAAVPDFLNAFTIDQPRCTEPVSLDAGMARCLVPGASIALIEDGAISGAWSAGVRRLGEPDPVTERTRFQAGSISKAVAAACALRLVADGRLDLDEDVNDRLRSWRVPANDGWQPRVTLRHLLSHTAGTTVHGFPGYPRGARVPSVPEVLDGHGNTMPVRVTTLPGLQYAYSGGGFTIMQLLLADVTGTDFATLAAELVLGPAGMADSTYAQPLPADLAATAAAGHRDGPTVVTGDWHTYPEQAAAGLWSTAGDLARFFLAVRDSCLGRPGALLPVEVARQMATPHAANSRYGLGLQLAAEGGPASVGHSGDDQGFQATAVVHLGTGHGITVMTNSDCGYGLIRELVLPVVGDRYGWTGRRRGTGTVPVGAGDLAGRYVGDEAEFVVRADHGDLELVLAGQPPVRLRRGADNEWHARTVNLDVSFHDDVLVVRQEVAGLPDVEARRKD